MTDVVKVSVNLPREMAEDLKRMAKESKITVTATVREAIDLRKFLGVKIKSGAKLLLEEKDKKLREVILLR